MSEEKDQRALQEKYIQFQMLNEQTGQLQQHLMKLDQQVEEIRRLIAGLDDLGKSGASEILAPLSNGIFIRTEVKDHDELLVNVGAGTVVKKTRAETRTLLEKQIEIMDENKKHAELQFAMMKDQMKRLETELRKMAE